MVRFDGRRWINLGSVFFVFIYTHNTLNYSYSLWKEEKGEKKYSFWAIARKQTLFWKFGREREFQGSEILAVKTDFTAIIGHAY